MAAPRSSPYRTIGYCLIAFALFCFARQAFYFSFGSSFRGPVVESTETNGSRLNSGRNWRVQYMVPGQLSVKSALYPYEIASGTMVTILVSPGDWDSFPLDAPILLLQAFFLALGFSFVFGSRVLAGAAVGTERETIALSRYFALATIAALVFLGGFLTWILIFR